MEPHPLGPEALAIELGQKLFLDFATWVGKQLKEGFYGDNQHQAMERVLRPAFLDLTGWLLKELDGDTEALEHLSTEVLGRFLAVPEVRRQLMMLAYAGLAGGTADPSPEQVRLRLLALFAEMGFEAETLGIDLGEALARLVASLATRVEQDARKPDSPHFASLVLSMLSTLVGRLAPDYEGVLKKYYTAVKAHCERLPYVGLSSGPLPALSSVYVAQTARAEQRQDHQKEEPVEETLANVVRQHACILLEGPGGIGKSTMVRALAREMAAACESGDAKLVPVLVPAPALAVATGPLAARLARLVPLRLDPDLQTRLPDDLFEHRPTPDGQWLVIVDGLDEVLGERPRTELERPIDVAPFEEVLNAWAADTGSPYRFLVTSRLSEASNRLSSTAFTRCTVQAFKPGQVTAFAQRWFAARGGGEGEAQRFLEEVRTRRLANVVQIPLLLTMACIVFEENRNRAGARLPGTRSKLYQDFVTILLDRQEGARSSRQRWVQVWEQFHGRDGVDSAERIYSHLRPLLEHLAFWSYQGGKDSLGAEALEWVLEQGLVAESLEDERWIEEQLQMLLVRTGLIVRQGSQFSFLHQTFRDFLLARHWARLPADSPELQAALRGEGGVTDEMLLFLFGARKEPRGQADQPSPETTAMLSLLWQHHRRGTTLAALTMAEGARVSPDLQNQIVDRLLGDLSRGASREFGVLASLPATEHLVEAVRSMALSQRLHLGARIRAAEQLYHLGQPEEAIRLLQAFLVNGGAEIDRARAVRLLDQAGIAVTGDPLEPAWLAPIFLTRGEAIVALARLGHMSDLEPLLAPLEAEALSSGWKDAILGLARHLHEAGLTTRAWLLQDQISRETLDAENTGWLAQQIASLGRPQEAMQIWKANLPRLGSSALLTAAGHCHEFGNKTEAEAMLRQRLAAGALTAEDWHSVLHLSLKISPALGREMAERFMTAGVPVHEIPISDMVYLIETVDEIGYRNQAADLFQALMVRPGLELGARFWTTTRLCRHLGIDPVPALTDMIAEAEKSDHGGDQLPDLLQALYEQTGDTRVAERMLELGMNTEAPFERRMQVASRLAGSRDKSSTVALSLAFEPGIPFWRRLQALRFAMEQGYRAELNTALTKECRRSDLTAEQVAFLTVGFSVSGQRERAEEMYRRLPTSPGYADQAAVFPVAVARGLMEPPVNLVRDVWQCMRSIAEPASDEELQAVVEAFFALCYAGEPEVLRLLVQQLPPDQVYLPELLLMIAEMLDQPVLFSGLMDTHDIAPKMLREILATRVVMAPTAQAVIRYHLCYPRGAAGLGRVINLLGESASADAVDPFLRLALCDLLTALGRTDEALVLLRKLLEQTWPSSPVGAAALQRLMSQAGTEAAADLVQADEIAALKAELDALDLDGLLRQIMDLAGGREGLYWILQRLGSVHPEYPRDLQKDLEKPDKHPVRLLQLHARLGVPLSELEAQVAKLTGDPDLVKRTVTVAHQMGMVGLTAPCVRLLTAAAPVLGRDPDLAGRLVWSAGLLGGTEAAAGVLRRLPGERRDGVLAKAPLVCRCLGL